jgi:hypothetical protein
LRKEFRVAREAVTPGETLRARRQARLTVSEKFFRHALIRVTPGEREADGMVKDVANAD